ncbi:MAG: hypothetical protein IT497_04710 [Ottowia sp.]|nr:hypothetical protein [Ottowia sp.]
MKIKISVIALCMFLVACSKKDEDMTKARTSLMLGTPKISTPMPVFVGQEPVQAGQDILKPDLKVPLSQYVDLNSKPDGFVLTQAVLARTSALRDEEKLNVLSSAYYNERDTFKKKEIAESQLPLINASLDDSRSKNYYHLPIDIHAEEDLSFKILHIEPYDFATKGFRLKNIFNSDYCWSARARSQQSAVLEIGSSSFPCHLSVEDESTARLIETARAQGALKTTGKLYVFITHMDDGKAMAVVTHAHLDLVNEKTKTLLASFDL